MSKKISIYKKKQSYLYDIIKLYPGINSGRKRYIDQYKRVLKNILISQAYQIVSKGKNFYCFKKFKFKENKKVLSIFFEK